MRGERGTGSQGEGPHWDLERTYGFGQYTGPGPQQDLYGTWTSTGPQQDLNRTWTSTGPGPLHLYTLYIIYNTTLLHHHPLYYSQKYIRLFLPKH